MLFIIVMDVLTGLIAKAEENNLLAPLLPGTVGQRMSAYANYVVILASPSHVKLSFIKNLLHIFGEASRLRTNMVKSLIVPIRCNDDMVQEIGLSMD